MKEILLEVVLKEEFNILLNVLDLFSLFIYDVVGEKILWNILLNVIKEKVYVIQIEI